jgi:hypothetical protein
MHLPRIFPLLVLGASLLSGCLDSVVPSHDVAGTGSGSGGSGGASDGASMEEPALFTMLGAAGYKASGFTQINATPYISSLDATHIRMFVSNDAVDAYKAVNPDNAATSGPAFPIGGIIVREASDANGNLMAITTMVKREAGYFPEVGDFFFGVLDPKGQPVSEAGVLEWGKVQMCAGCHEPRQAAGFLFGVAPANRH